MEEKPEVLASPEAQTENPKPEKSKTMLIVVGLVVVLLLFVGAVLLLSNNSTDNGQSAKVTTTNSTQEIQSTSDLDKVSKDLDSEDLSSYEQELNQNSQDAAAF